MAILARILSSKNNIFGNPARILSFSPALYYIISRWFYLNNSLAHLFFFKLARSHGWKHLSFERRWNRFSQLIVLTCWLPSLAFQLVRLSRPGARPKYFVGSFPATVFSVKWEFGGPKREGGTISQGKMWTPAHLTLKPKVQIHLIKGVHFLICANHCVL